LKALIKPQYVDQIPKAVKGTVQQLIDKKDERKNQSEICRLLGKPARNIHHGTLILGIRSPRQLNIILLHLIFVGRQYLTCICHLSGTQNFELASRFLENLCISDIHCSLHYKVKVTFTVEQAMKAQMGEQRYSATLSLTLALGGGGVNATPWPP